MEETQPPVQPSEAASNDSPQTEALDVAELVAAIVFSKTYTQAAKRLGIDRTTLYRRIDKFGLRPILDTIPQQASESLKISSLKAALNLVDDLDSYNPKIRQDASKYILDKALPQEPKVQVNVNQQNNTFVSLTDFVGEMQRRKEARTKDETGDNQGTVG